MKADFKTIWRIICVLAFVGYAAVYIFSPPTNEIDSKRVLDDQGFTDVKFTGYVYGACSSDDFYHTGFTAHNAQGKPIQGVVCCGAFMRACTIRW